jgi:hypothetical protein
VDGFGDEQPLRGRVDGVRRRRSRCAVRGPQQALGQKGTAECSAVPGEEDGLGHKLHRDDANEPEDENSSFHRHRSTGTRRSFICRRGTTEAPLQTRLECRGSCRAVPALTSSLWPTLRVLDLRAAQGLVSVRQTLRTSATTLWRVRLHGSQSGSRSSRLCVGER